jgi:hypothetical protein
MLKILTAILEALAKLPSPRRMPRGNRPGSFANKLDATRTQRFN